MPSAGGVPMASIAGSAATRCDIRRQREASGGRWHLNKMRQLPDAKNRRGSKTDKEDVIGCPLGSGNIFDVRDVFAHKQVKRIGVAFLNSNAALL